MSDAINTSQDDTGGILGVTMGLLGAVLAVYFVRPDSFLTFCGTAVAGLFGSVLWPALLYFPLRSLVLLIAYMRCRGS
jgi:hypothetical protein